MKKLFTLALLASAALLNAQPERLISPSRGFQPGHSYSLDDIESIDKGTGSVSLHIPITQLPPGRAGFTSGVTLPYSNRYFDAESKAATNTEYQLIYDVRGTGGWRLSMIPSLEYQIASFLDINDPCQTQVPGEAIRYGFVNPDGTRNALYRSSPAPDPLQPNCAGTYKIPEMKNVQSTWFSADGSFIRATVTPRTITCPNGASIATTWPENSDWVVVRKDGSSVTFDTCTKVTTLKDRNGNQIKCETITNSGVTYELMTDAFGRTIRIDRSSAADTVTQASHTDTPNVWTINWTSFPILSQTYQSQPTGNNTLPLSLGTKPKLSTSLVLPNTRSYTFGYEPRYGQLSSVLLPTGASVQYKFRLDDTVPAVKYHQVLANTITSKKVIHDGVTEEWTYAYEVAPSGSYFQSVVTAPDGGQSLFEFNSISYWDGAGLPMGGMLTRIVNPDGSETRRVWQINSPAELPPAAPVFPNTWVARELTSVANSTAATVFTATNQPVAVLGSPVATSVQVFTVDKNGNQTSREERAWVPYSANPPALGSLLRRIVSTYESGAGDSSVTSADSNTYSSTSPNSVPKNLVKITDVQSGAGLVIARDQFAYSLATGNLTEELHWDDTKGAVTMPLTTSNAVKRSYTYSSNGNVETETDANLRATSYENSGCGTDLYRSKMTQGGIGTVARSTLYGYTQAANNDGCRSGLRTTVTDPNSLVTTIVYDRFGRPETFNEGGYRTTNHTYNDADRWIVTRNDSEIAGDQKNFSVLHFDTLGRVRQSRQLVQAVADAAAAVANEGVEIRVDTKYVFSAGRNDVLVSNPYQAGSETITGWTVTRRDKAGRVCWEENHAGSADPVTGTNCDPSTSSALSGKSSHSYTAGTTLVYRSETVADAAGKSRMLAYDVLGRLTGVMEDPSTLKYSTFYKYDLNDNLTSVRQVGKCTATTDPMSDPDSCPGGLSRTFTYSSLKRLTNAANPESGGIAYAYDNNGNVIKRVHGAVTRCASATAVGGTCAGAAGYDDLNRLVRLSYSDNTPAVTYTYDSESANHAPTCGPGAPMGRLSSVQTSVSASYYFYTPLGYPLCNRQSTGGTSYDLAYTMSPQGAIKDLTYPSGRVVRYTHDDVGRVNGVTNVATNAPYASNLQYASHGPLKSMVLGNNALTEAWTYNSRLQPATLTAGNLSLNYSYCAGQAASCSTNNGNLLYQGISRAGSTWTQNYTYDSVNRLSTAAETGAGNWNQSYGFDERGNRWICAHGGLLPGLTLETAQNIGNCGSPAGWYGSSDNKLAPSTWTYERGNLTAVSGMNRNFSYDGENRQLTAVINGQTSTYSYDGEGHRVKAETPTGTTVYVYDAGGQLTAEYGPNTDFGTQYVAVDHLGSTRLITDAAGVPAKCYDYLPFGETIPATAGRNGTGLGCFGAASDNTVDFTGKERDAESGLDYFGARYLSSAQGRFTSPDEFTGGLVDAYGQQNSQPSPLPYADIANPQSLNKYAYTVNNPLRYTDPDGHLVKEVVTATEAVATVSLRMIFYGLGGFFGMASTGSAEGFNEDAYLEELRKEGREDARAKEDEKPPEASGSGKKGGGKKGGRTPHGQDRKDEARSGDTHREVGDANRVINEGRQFRDTETGNNVSVNGDRVVIRNREGDIVSQFKNTRANTQQRIQSGKWEPIQKQ